MMQKQYDFMVPHYSCRAKDAIGYQVQDSEVVFDTPKLVDWSTNFSVAVAFMLPIFRKTRRVFNTKFYRLRSR